MHYLYLVFDPKKSYLKYSLNLSCISYTKKSKYYIMNYQIPLYAAIELKEMHEKYIKNRIYVFLKRLVNINLMISMEIFVLTILARKLFISHDLMRFNSVKWNLMQELSVKAEISEEEKIEFLRLLEGRVLMKSEISRTLQHLGAKEDEISFFLQRSIDEEKCLVKPGVVYEFEGWQCNRCKTKGKFAFFACLKCGSKRCVLCKECMNLGKVSACEDIYFFHASSKELSEKLKSGFVEVHYDYSLTSAQQEVSDRLGNWFNGVKKEALVWAVCGAGKTEVTFKIISQAIMHSQKVMIAVPRRDIVSELSKRLRHAFPNAFISALYGGSKEKYDPDSEILICTTHQAMRFFKKFDLTIIDEIDAYPYKGSGMLHFAVKRAMKDESKLVMMTATPSKDLRRKAENGEIECFKIPARHHRCPLPVPEIFFCEDKLDAEKLPKKVIELILSSTSQGYRLFIFVPRRSMAQRVKLSLEYWFKDQKIERITVECCTSADVKRSEKCESFAEGDIDIFVVTSILERGITIDKSNVVVLMADDDHIFDDNALIQMAGRAGRTTKNPLGEVFFVCNKENKEIRSAINQIKGMNHYAYERGYIDYE